MKTAHAVTAAAAAALAASLTACSFSASTSDYAGAKLAKEVSNALAKSSAALTITDVTCKDTPEIAEGKTTACHALVNGQRTALTVTWKDSNGNFSVSS